MDVAALEAQIAEDRAAGLTPACVAASAGTVNTGAIDPLDRIAELCRARAALASRGRRVRRAGGARRGAGPSVRGLERADSVAIDPHKWMYVPVECGCALVRDRQRDAGHVLARPAVPARRRRAAVVLGVRHSTEPRVQGAQAVDGAAANRASTGYRPAIAHDIAWRARCSSGCVTPRTSSS